jgi:hypothetical protein
MPLNTTTSAACPDLSLPQLTDSLLLTISIASLLITVLSYGCYLK